MSKVRRRKNEGSRTQTLISFKVSSLNISTSSFAASHSPLPSYYSLVHWCHALLFVLSPGKSHNIRSHCHKLLALNTRKNQGHLVHPIEFFRTPGESPLKRLSPENRDKYNSQYHIIFITENLKFKWLSPAVKRIWDLVFPLHCHCNMLHKSARNYIFY